MKIITYLDHDDKNRPVTNGTAVFAVKIPLYNSKEQLFELHPVVFFTKGGDAGRTLPHLTQSRCSIVHE